MSCSKANVSSVMTANVTMILASRPVNVPVATTISIKTATTAPTAFVKLPALIQSRLSNVTPYG